MEKETEERVERPKHLFRRRNTSQSIELEETKEKDERSSDGHATDEDAFSGEMTTKDKTPRTKTTLVKKERRKESKNARLRKHSGSSTASESNYFEKAKRVRPKSSRSRLSSHSTVNIEFRNDGMEDLVVVQNPSSGATIGSETDSCSNKELLPSKEINKKQKANSDGGKKKQTRFVPRKPTTRVEIAKELINEYYLDSLEVFEDPVYVPHAIWEQSYEDQMSRAEEYKSKDKQTMIRVGGGYMELPFYLRHHLPIKIYQRNNVSLSSNYGDDDSNEFVIKARRQPNSSRVPKHFERPSWCTVSNGHFKGFASTVLRVA